MTLNKSSFPTVITRKNPIFALMTGKSTHNFFTRLLCLLLALHFLNFSIDSKDLHPDSTPEDLSFNDIESVAEFFAEVVLKHHDAFKEHDEKDNEDGGSLGICKFYFPNKFMVIEDLSCNTESTHTYQIVNYGEVLPPTGTVSLPPPKG
jgi:hypothetical protein